MFTIFSCFNSKLITDKEYDYLIYYIDKYKKTENGNWLNKVDISKIKFYWCYSMNDENAVLGSWNMFLPNNIYIKAFDENKLTGNEQFDKISYESHFKLIIPTVFHELYHRYQCKILTPLIYAFAAFPYIREFTIEPAAYDISDNAYDWMEELEQQKFNETKNKLHNYFYKDNFDINTFDFIENYDKTFCEQQYNLYQKMKKEGKVPVIPTLTIPPHMI